MSIRNKFESIKKEVEAKKTEFEIVQGKETINELIDKKNILSDKISSVRDILSKLEGIFTQSGKNLIDFKTRKEQIGALFNEYKNYLAEKDINSITDLLNHPEFADEEDIKKNNRVSPRQDAEGKRGDLGENIEKAIKIKEEAKESLSDLDLDFHGGLKKGEETSPRQQSLIKIKDYLEKLKDDLKVLNDQEQKLKTEHLPRIKELVAENIEKIFSSENLSIAPMVENLNLIKDEIFELCGDEFWPEVKKIATEVFNKKYQETFNEKKSDADIDKSLEMEKLIFEAKNIREKHKDLIVLDNDNKSFKNFLENDRFFIKGTIDPEYKNEQVLIKDKKAYLGQILSQIEYFAEKNVEAKAVCEKIIEYLKQKIKELEAKIPSGFFAGKSAKEDIENFTTKFKGIKEALNNTEAPENFYSENSYEFNNSFIGMLDSFRMKRKSDKEWAVSLEGEFRKIRDEVSIKISNLVQQEGESLAKLSNNIYYLAGNDNFEKINGFKAIYLDIKKTSAYEYSYDKNDFDNFLEGLSGKKLSREELEQEVNKRKELLNEKIANYPNSKEILRKFHGLLERYEKDFKFQSQSEAIQKKNYYRNNDHPRYFQAIDSYKFGKKLFYGEDSN